jgi:excinuclease ABC subunit A
VVLAGPEEKKHITVTSRNGVHELDFTFRNARLTVLSELERAADEKRLARVSRFLTEAACPSCAGTRLSEAARAPRIGELGLADVTALTLDGVLDWAPTVAATLPADMRPMAASLVDTLTGMARRLIELGLGYLTLDRASSTLSTGERQRAQLARAVRNRTTGVLYVLDEPSIGLHPSNVEGLIGVMHDLLTDGTSVVFVDHDVQILREAAHLVEIGPGSGRAGGTVIATGTAEQLAEREHVRHPAGDPELHGPVEVRAPGDVEPGEAAGRVAGGAAEVQQPVALRLQPAVVRRVRDPARHWLAPSRVGSWRSDQVSPGRKVATPRVESLCP